MDPLSYQAVFVMTALKGKALSPLKLFFEIDFLLFSFNYYSLLQESLETQLRKPDILTADLSKMEVSKIVFVAYLSIYIHHYFVNSLRVYLSQDDWVISDKCGRV